MIPGRPSYPCPRCAAARLRSWTWCWACPHRGQTWHTPPLPRPGGDAWLRIDLADGGAEYESTDRGWISYLNDLHKGRNAGPAWSWFIDIFAGACLVFCVTGFFILQMHAGRRPMTWPMVGLGLLVPCLLALLLVH